MRNYPPAKNSRWLVAIVVLAAVTAACTPSSGKSGQLGDLVWHDLNNNGIQDPAEPGVAGIGVSLLTADGELVGSTQTDQAGQYGFSDVADGSYILRFTIPTGWITTQANAGDSDERDSDVNPGSVETEPFEFRSSSGDPTRDMGLLESIPTPTPTHTPTLTPSPTATSTSTPVPPQLAGEFSLEGQFVRVEGACGAFSEFTSLLFITIDPDGRSITFFQPITNDMNTGTIESDGSFRVSSERESYEGQIEFERDENGRIVRITLFARNIYENAVGCVEVFEVFGTAEVNSDG